MSHDVTILEDDLWQFTGPAEPTVELTVEKVREAVRRLKESLPLKAFRCFSCQQVREDEEVFVMSWRRWRGPNEFFCWRCAEELFYMRLAAERFVKRVSEEREGSVLKMPDPNRTMAGIATTRIDIASCNTEKLEVSVARYLDTALLERESLYCYENGQGGQEECLLEWAVGFALGRGWEIPEKFMLHGDEVPMPRKHTELRLDGREHKLQTALTNAIQRASDIFGKAESPAARLAVHLKTSPRPTARDFLGAPPGKCELQILAYGRIVYADILPYPLELQMAQVALSKLRSHMRNGELPIPQYYTDDEGRRFNIMDGTMQVYAEPAPTPTPVRVLETPVPDVWIDTEFENHLRDEGTSALRNLRVEVECVRDDARGHHTYFMVKIDGEKRWEELVPPYGHLGPTVIRVFEWLQRNFIPCPRYYTSHAKRFQMPFVEVTDAVTK